MLVCSDDFLLELEREDLEAQWLAAHPDGERVVLAGEPVGLLREVSTPSLFFAERLLVVRDAAALLAPPRRQSAEDSSAARGLGNRHEEELAAGLRSAPRHGVTVLLSLQAGSAPKGAVADVVQELGRIHVLPLPAPPKPWEQVSVTPDQRRVLLGLIRRVAPAVAGLDETVDALCECYGFRPRELAQAAQRLVLAGTLSSEAVRVQAGAGEVALSDLEDALMAVNTKAAARFVAALAAGASLRLFGDRLVERDGVGPVVSGSLARLLRQALAVRRHAREAGLAGDLDPARCNRPSWYGQRFKTGIFPRLQQEAADAEASPLAGVKSAWAAHRVFKIAAVYGERELLRALSGLGRLVPERENSPASAMAALAPALIGLTNRSARSPVRRASGG